ncbi:MAG: outer membrane protein [Chitinophagaceae bacterium]|nr:outer membrane protein [Chitinophagaceae bacterium]
MLLHRTASVSFLATLTLFFTFSISNAQNIEPLATKTDSISCYTIRNVTLSGNKRTKDFIITRELDFKPGDSICSDDFTKRFEKNGNRIFNTGLFISVKIVPSFADSQAIELTIVMEERFYSYPIPLVGLADRNFSEWWNQRGHDLSRLDWGVRFVQKNVRGRNETLRIRGEFGFNKKFEVDYTFPYINRKLKTGLSVYAGAILNRQVAYRTTNHKLTYTEDNGFLRERYAAGVTIFRRNNYYVTHSLSLYGYNNIISDTVARLNPNYFLDGRTSQLYPSLHYSYTNDHRDIQYYPLKGYYIDVDVEANGLGISPDINYSFLKLDVSKFTHLTNIHRKLFAAVGLKGKASTPDKQPFFNQRGLGYDKENISGYELYVIDGQHFVMTKMHLKWQLFRFNTRMSGIPIENFKNVPLALYFKLHADAGYVSNMYPTGNERFANHWLNGFGAGLDFATYYDFVIRFEYSINGAGETGFFINFKAGI